MKWFAIMVATGLVGAIFAAADAAGQPATQASLRSVGPEEFAAMQDTPGTVLLDVRTPEEYQQGHLPGAKLLIDYHAADFEQKIDGLPRGKTYLVYCRSGHRSLNACELMQAKGFTTLVDLKGGILSWEKAGKPVDRAGAK